MATLFTQNSKMKHSSSGDSKYMIYNFGLPAIKTCPSAGACKALCYADQGAYKWPVVAAAYEARYQASLEANFVQVAGTEIAKLVRKADKAGKTLAIRIHDSGDFYSAEYYLKWRDIIEQFTSVQFYAYTKQVRLLSSHIQPANFTLIFSEGGIHDDRIDHENDRHSRVFDNLESLLAAGYVDASEDDTVAFTHEGNRIGLVYHGARKPVANNGFVKAA